MQRAVWADSTQHNKILFFRWYVSSRSSLNFSQYHDSKIFWLGWPQWQICCNFVASWEVYHLPDLQRSHTLCQYLEKKEIQSKVIVISRACMCVKNKRRRHEMVHSHFTIRVLKWVLLHMCMYKDSGCVCQCLCFWGFFYTFATLF